MFSKLRWFGRTLLLARSSTKINRNIYLQPSYIKVETTTSRLIDRFNKQILQKTMDTNQSNPLATTTPPFNLSQLSFDQLIATIQTATSDTTDIRATSNLITALDIESLLRVQHLEHSELLSLIGAFHRILPSVFMNLECYPSIMVRLTNTYESDQRVDDFVRICFYLGAAKKRHNLPQVLDQLLWRHFNKYLDKVDALDLAIVGTASYRAAVTLKPIQAKRYEQEILQISHEKKAIIDWPLVNAYIKVLRLNRVRSEKVIRTIIGWMQSGRMDQVDFCVLAHFFVYFADNRFMEIEAMQWFCRRAMEIINGMSAEEILKPFDADTGRGLREKDVRLFLWCMAHLNGNGLLSEPDMDRLVRIMLAKFRAGEFKDEDSLVDLSMALWQLGYASRELFRGIFGTDFREQTFDKNRFKLDTRKYLLLFCVQVERPDWLAELGISSSSDAFRMDRTVRNKFLKKIDELQRVHTAIRQLMPNDALVEVVAPIRNLNIPGILVTIGSENRYIEVLERHMVLSDGKTAFGTMQLKIRLLEQLGFKVDLINSLDQGDDDLIDRINEILFSNKRETR